MVVSILDLHQRSKMKWNFSLIPSPVDQTMRNTLMELFIDNLQPLGRDLVRNHRPVLQVCGGWYGITCIQEEISEIILYEFKYGNFNISAVPHTVTTINIRQCGQEFPINTRNLPRNLAVISLAYNTIHGHLDLTILPTTLVQGDFSYNEMTGPVNLTRLPRRLRMLKIESNAIFQHTIWYGDLPDTLATILLTSWWKRNKIREVRPVLKNDSAKALNIFREFPKTRVH